MLLATSAAAKDFNLPNMGAPSGAILPPLKAERIGRRIIQQMRARNRILEDPELTAYINRIGTRLARTVEHAVSDFDFFVINDNAVNAFALPGGYIGVNAGLIQATDTESELAGVLAHEIAHITQRHIARQIRASRKITLTTAAAMLLAILAGGGSPAVVQAAITMGLAHISQRQITFTRAHELEADRLGIRTLAEAGFNPHGMASFFEEMARRARLYGNRLPEILRSHPMSTTRIAEARSRLLDFNPTHVHETRDYPWMRARARVLASERAGEVLRYFRSKTQAADGSLADDYGYALALMQVGRNKDAVAILERLRGKERGEPHVVLALADAQLAEGHTKAALETLNTLRWQYASYRPMILAYAKALLRNGKPRAARDYLLDQTQLVGVDPAVHRILARALARLGRKADAFYQQARMHRLRGQYVAAIQRLKTALELEDLSATDKSRIEAALRRYRNACHRILTESECRKRVQAVVRG